MPRNREISGTSAPVLFADPVLVGAAGDVGNPGLVVEIPLHCLADAGLEGLGRLPAEFPFELAGVDGVATVVAGAVLHVGNLFLVRFAVGTWAEFVEDGAQGMDDVKVGHFVPAADVVDLAHPARLQHAADGAAVVLDVEPVADLLAVTVDGQLLAGQCIVDDQRDELFREVVGAVVVGAVGGQHRQTVGVVVGAHEVVAGGLARRVRTVGFVAVGFGERRIHLGQRPIDFVGGDVQEAEVVLRFGGEAVPVGADGFEEAEGADDVGLDKVFRAVDAAVDVRFGGKVDDGARLVLGEQPGDEVEVADVALDEAVALVAAQGCEVLEIAGIRERVQVDDGFIGLRQPVEDEVAADKTCCTSDQNHFFAPRES